MKNKEKFKKCFKIGSYIILALLCLAFCITGLVEQFGVDKNPLTNDLDKTQLAVKKAQQVQTLTIGDWTYTFSDNGGTGISDTGYYLIDDFIEYGTQSTAYMNSIPLGYNNNEIDLRSVQYDYQNLENYYRCTNYVELNKDRFDFVPYGSTEYSSIVSSTTNSKLSSVESSTGLMIALFKTNLCDMNFNMYDMPQEVNENYSIYNYKLDHYIDELIDYGTGDDYNYCPILFDNFSNDTLYCAWIVSEQQFNFDYSINPTNFLEHMYCDLGDGYPCIYYKCDVYALDGYKAHISSAYYPSTGFDSAYVDEQKNLSYQEGYSVGYTDGQTEEQTHIDSEKELSYNTGYSNGYSQGETSGYNSGYDAGYATGTKTMSDITSQTSNLFIQILNTPYTIIKDSFGEINLFGINLGSIVLAFVSLTLVMFAIKTLRGGK